MASFVDLYRWTVVGETTRTEDFLSGCLALTARHDQELARELVGLLAPRVPVPPHATVLVGFQEAAVHNEKSGGRTDLTLEVGDHRVVVECKVGRNALDIDALRRYSDCTRPPRTVVGLVETSPAAQIEGFPVAQWQKVAELLLGRPDFHRGFGGELLHLLRYMGLGTRDELPDLDPDRLRRSLDLIQRGEESICTGLASLLAGPLAAELKQRTAEDADNDDESWRAADLGWGWWGASPLKGTRLKGIELSAQRSAAGGLEWTIELLASRRDIRAGLPTDEVLPWGTGEDEWVMARLGDMGRGAFAETLEAALEKARGLLRATASRRKELGLRLSSGRRAGTATAATSVEQLVDAIEECNLFESTGASLGQDLVNQVRSQAERMVKPHKLTPNRVWSRQGQAPRFYIPKAERNVVGMGIYFRQQKKPGRRFKTWLWAPHDEARRRILAAADKMGLEPALEGRNVWVHLVAGGTDPNRAALPALAEQLAAALAAGI